MEEENNKFIIISSYEEHVKYWKNVIDNKEHRSPIFTGVGEGGKSILTIMIQNGDIDETKVDAYFKLKYTNL